MNDRETVFENNLERLLLRSCGRNTRATAAMERTLRREWRSVRSQAQAAEFPNWVLGVMSGALVMVAVLGAALGWNGRWLAVNSPGISPFGTLVLVNLVCLPVASLVIVIRRRYA
jgi:hypothetical protein